MKILHTQEEVQEMIDAENTKAKPRTSGLRVLGGILITMGIIILLPVALTSLGAMFVVSSMF